MLQLNIFLMFTIFGNLFPSQAIITEDRGILVLTTENFNQGLKTHKFLLVEFYAPWCGYCQNFSPVFVKTAEMLEKSGSPVKLAKVDATKEIELNWAHDIEGYPTLVFFKSGSSTEYKGNKTAAEIIKWLSQNTQ